MPNMRAKLYLFAIAAIFAAPTIGHSQRIGNPPSSFESESGGTVPSPSALIPATTLQTIRDSTVYRRSYWQEGLVTGAVIGALLGAVAASGLCSMSETSNSSCGLAAIKGALLLGAPGATVGALIGGLFSRPDPPPGKAF